MAPLANDSERTGADVLRMWAALAVVYVVWGSTYLAIRITVRTIPPMFAAGVRFLIAGLILAAFLAIKSGPRRLVLPPRQLSAIAVVGVLLLVCGNGVVGLAEKHIDSGLAALLVASVPLWLVVLRIIGKDRPASMTIAGVVFGFAGLGVLSGGGAGATIGIVMTLIAAMCWAIGSYSAGKLPMPRDALVASCYEMLIGGAGCMVVSASTGEMGRLHTPSLNSVLALIYLVTAGSLLAFTCYSWLLHNAPISLVGTYAYVNPAVAVLLGAVLLGEKLAWPMLAGGAIILIGVGLVVSTERPPRDPDQPVAAAPDMTAGPDDAGPGRQMISHE